jgi:hypothetical protein
MEINMHIWRMQSPLSMNILLCFPSNIYPYKFSACSYKNFIKGETWYLNYKAN